MKNLTWRKFNTGITDLKSRNVTCTFHWTDSYSTIRYVQKCQKYYMLHIISNLYCQQYENIVTWSPGVMQNWCLANNFLLGGSLVGFCGSGNFTVTYGSLKQTVWQEEVNLVSRGEGGRQKPQQGYTNSLFSSTQNICQVTRFSQMLQLLLITNVMIVYMIIITKNVKGEWSWI